MTTTQTHLLTWHTDPGHGWLEVPAGLVTVHGITPSRYSYSQGGNYYLEEDCDAPRFLKALEATGVTVNFKEKHTNHDHPIRSYRRCPGPSPSFDDAHNDATRAMMDAYEPTCF
jgi:hypothetical protein